jgi:MoaA/NifB/PqqE/SkfB family radical SAM enzyme
VIRRIYIDMIKEKVASGDLGWLARAALRYPLLKLSSARQRPLCGPVLGTLIATYRCNYKCAMCDLPSKSPVKEGVIGKELNTAGMLGLIDQMKALGVLGVGFTGGEPLLRDDIIELLSYTRKLGMLTHLNTNGSLLSDSVIREVIAAGVDSLNISLDGADPETHDSIRGVDGAWVMATDAVRRMVRSRGQSRRPRVKVVTVVSSRNLEELPEMVDLVAGLGADCLEFIPEQPFTGSRDQTVAAIDPARVTSTLDETLTRARGQSLRIENSTRMLKLICSTLSGEKSPVKCSALYNSITVDCYGQLFPCLPHANWSRPLRMTEGKTLKGSWLSKEYSGARGELADCRECTLNCHAELNLMFQPFRQV